MRLADVYALFEKAEGARKAGKLAEMREGYDEILTKSPLFDGRATMALGYLKYAEASDTKKADGLLAARRALRITTDDSIRKKAQSLVETLTAEQLKAQGLFDRALLDQAISLDPDNGTAQTRRASLGTDSPSVRLSAITRYGGAFLACALALLGAGWILWSSRGVDHKTPTAKAEGEHGEDT
jgi:hypothetical protein